MRTLDYANRAKNIKNKPVVLLDPQQVFQMLYPSVGELEAINWSDAIP